MSPGFLTVVRRMLALLSILGFSCSQVYGLDVVILDRPLSVTDRRNEYADKLLRVVMERTVREYGPYRIELASKYMERKRLLEELKIGRLVNVAAQPSQPSWESELKPIWIPVDMGLQSWRISLIDDRNQQRLSQIETLGQLKALTLGIGKGWASFGVLQENGFTLEPGSNYDGLFEMLTLRRFDHFLRGVNEIYFEFDDRKEANPHLAVEESFVVHVPLPWLFFTSPATPRLAQRISAGMESMLNDGSLRRFMLDYHRAYLQRANLCGRRVFEVSNPFVPPKILARKEIWFDPFDASNGICPKSSHR